MRHRLPQVGDRLAACPGRPHGHRVRQQRFQHRVSVPSCVSTAITVGNTTKADAVAASSNSSAQVELLAPGTSIVSSVPGGGTATSSGTSMATPHVAGAWAVYRERFPSASVPAVLAALRNTGTPITDPDNNVTVPRINLNAAIG